MNLVKGIDHSLELEASNYNKDLNMEDNLNSIEITKFAKHILKNMTNLEELELFLVSCITSNSSLNYCLGGYSITLKLFDQLKILKLLNFEVNEMDLKLIKVMVNNNNLQLKTVVLQYIDGYNAYNWLLSDHSKNSALILVHFLPIKVITECNNKQQNDPWLGELNSNDIIRMIYTVIKEKKTNDFVLLQDIMKFPQDMKNARVTLCGKWIWTAILRCSHIKEKENFIKNTTWPCYIQNYNKK